MICSASTKFFIYLLFSLQHPFYILNLNLKLLQEHKFTFYVNKIQVLGINPTFIKICECVRYDTVSCVCIIYVSADCQYINYIRCNFGDSKNCHFYNRLL